MMHMNAKVLIRAVVLGALGLAIGSALPDTAEAGRVKITEISASSTLVDDNGASYPASKMKDGKVGTAWFEGEKGAGVGSKVTIKFESTDLQKLKIWPGYWFTAADWEQNYRPKQVKVTAGSKSVTVDFEDKQEAVEADLGGVKTDTVVIELLSAHSAGAAWDATGISEIQVFDSKPATLAMAKGFTSSSNADADADGNYLPANTMDGLKDTMWCEGAKDEGVGQSVTFDLGAKTSITGVALINGVASSSAIFKKYGRIEEATLAFDDGSTETVTFKAFMPMPEKKTFAAKSTSKVVLTINKVKPGTDPASKDTCISEISFLQ